MKVARLGVIFIAGRQLVLVVLKPVVNFLNYTPFTLLYMLYIWCAIRLYFNVDSAFGRLPGLNGR